MFIKITSKNKSSYSANHKYIHKQNGKRLALENEVRELYNLAEIKMSKLFLSPQDDYQWSIILKINPKSKREDLDNTVKTWIDAISKGLGIKDNRLSRILVLRGPSDKERKVEITVIIKEEDEKRDEAMSLYIKEKEERIEHNKSYEL